MRELLERMQEELALQDYLRVKERKRVHDIEKRMDKLETKIPFGQKLVLAVLITSLTLFAIACTISAVNFYNLTL